MRGTVDGEESMLLTSASSGHWISVCIVAASLCTLMPRFFQGICKLYKLKAVIFARPLKRTPEKPGIDVSPAS